MNAVTMAGVISTLMFVGSNLPMVVQAVRSRDVSSYSRGYLVMTNIGNAVYTIYVLSLPAGPIWALHLVYTSVSAFMLLVHVRWRPSVVADWSPTAVMAACRSVRRIPADGSGSVSFPAYTISRPTAVR
jgi:uncharacterized protein with PQ loop repeat